MREATGSIGRREDDRRHRCWRPPSGRAASRIGMPCPDMQKRESPKTRIPARRCEVLLHSVLQLRTTLRADSVSTSRGSTSQHDCSARLRRAHRALRFTARPARRCEVLLHSAPHHAADNPLLGEDVDDEHRSHSHQVGGEGHRIVRGELALEHVLGKRNGLVALIGQGD